MSFSSMMAKGLKAGGASRLSTRAVSPAVAFLRKPPGRHMVLSGAKSRA
ncbi:hypothetical protein [Methylobacterium gnaphalii]|nr:hypothetical protein [Methylobacterium gnaphalii]